MELTDIYVFISKFDPYQVKYFYDKYLDGFDSMDTYFEYPKYGIQTEFETESFFEMFDYVLKKKGRPFTFYFSNKENSKYKQSIIQINKDGSMCLALCTELNFETEVYDKLKKAYPNYRIILSNNSSLPLSINNLNTI